jgi:hypothetical protein
VDAQQFEAGHPLDRISADGQHWNAPVFDLAQEHFFGLGVVDLHAVLSRPLFQLATKFIHPTGGIFGSNYFSERGVVNKLVDSAWRLKVVDDCDKSQWAQPRTLWKTSCQCAPCGINLANFDSLFPIFEERKEPFN